MVLAESNSSLAPRQLPQLPCGRSASEQTVAQRLHVGRPQIASSPLQLAQNSGLSPVGSHGLPHATHRGGKSRSMAEATAFLPAAPAMLARVAFILSGFAGGLIVPRRSPLALLRARDWDCSHARQSVGERQKASIAPRSGERGYWPE